MQYNLPLQKHTKTILVQLHSNPKRQAQLGNLMMILQTLEELITAEILASRTGQYF